MEYVVAFIVLVGVLIWFHELGHFLMAKLFGVKVETFSIGFGPVILKKQIGETEYRLSALPLGGFVKLYGEEESLNDPRAFSSKPNWQKILIAFGGPLFNFVLAVILFALLALLGKEEPAYLYQKPVVGHVQENTLAQRLGVQAGDVILEVNHKKVENWKELERVVVDNLLSKEWTVKVLRDGKELELKLSGRVESSGGFGAEPFLPAVIGRVLKNSPAQQVGLKEGAKILEVNGKPVKSWYELVSEVRKSKGEPVSLKVEQDGVVQTKVVVPNIDARTGTPLLGIAPKVETIKVKKGFLQAIEEGVEKTYKLTLLSLKALWGIITGGISIKTLGGPVAIAQLAGESAQQGILPFLGMMAFISVQLAVFNLIPLPVLDGGLILLFLIESLRGKPLPSKFKEVWARVGFALIITLAVFVFINDLIRLFQGVKP